MPRRGEGDPASRPHTEGDAVRTTKKKQTRQPVPTLKPRRHGAPFAGRVHTFIDGVDCTAALQRTGLRHDLAGAEDALAWFAWSGEPIKGPDFDTLERQITEKARREGREAKLVCVPTGRERVAAKAGNAS